MSIHVRSGRTLHGIVTVPGDKSLSHRAVILGALAEGTTQVRGWLPAGDTLATLDCIQALGITVKRHDEATLMVHGQGLHGLQVPAHALDCKNAGTGLRLLAGVLAGQRFESVLDGSEQLRQRPMRRITDPLREMGAQVKDQDGRAPLHFSPATLHGITYHMPVASAQVKSCLLLAGLFADGDTTVIEPGPARDHTERMLVAMGATIQSQNSHVTVSPGAALAPLDLTIPGDMSSAAFLLVAALITNSAIQITNVGVNPTRAGIVELLTAMGADIRELNPREAAGEPVADLDVNPSSLRGTAISGDVVVRAIDEFPALMVAATQAEGETVVTDAAELRVKET
ncbi:MAG: 3-phosphoshikimate 1-carboxyvinyltransferase, partial [Chloroflexi bacterium]|nr:3-phosphoshikimate 1-carboxyvinyltransferase [Chloroflexota bacterium]